MVVHSSEIRVGLMVVLSIALMIVISISVGQLGDIFSDTIRIKIQIPSAAGLDDYAPVKYAGDPIGRVMDFYFDETIEQVVIIAGINRDSPVCLDSVCHLASSTLLSPLYIEISGGSRDQKIKHLLKDRKIKEVDIVLNAEAYLSISDLFALAADVKDTLLKVQSVLDHINEPLMAAGDLVKNISNESEVLLDKLNLLLTDGHDRIGDTLGNVNNLVKSASAEVVPTLKNIRKGSNQFPDLLTGMDQKLQLLLNDADTLINNIHPEVKAISQELQTAVQSLQNRVANVEQNLISVLNNADSMLVDNKDELKMMIQNLQRTSQNLDDMMEQISQHPWRVLWKTDARQQPQKVSPDWNPELTKP